MKTQIIGAPFWLKSAAIYQINPRTFSKEGTIKAVTKALPELKELGFEIMYLCPIFEADADEDATHWSERQKKYGTMNPKNPYRIKDYFKVDEEYGSAEDLKEFVDTAHRFGMRVILDLVYTHIGPNADIINKHPEFAVRNDDGNIVYNEYHFITLNYDSQGLREYLYSNIMYYLCQFDVDGFRCDYSDPTPEDFWAEALRRMQIIKPEAILIEEGYKKERLVTAFNAMYGFSWHEDLYKLLNGAKNALQIRNSYESFKKDFPIGGYVLRDLENHDTVTDWPLRCELVAGSAAMELMLVLNYVIDGIPMVYCGNELADTSRHNMFANRFFPGVYEVTDRRIGENEEGKRRQYVIRLLNAIRKDNSALIEGETVWINNSKEDKVLSFVRITESETVLFIGNFSAESLVVKLDYNVFEGDRLINANDKFIGQNQFELYPFGYSVIKKK